jgi:hypothetical protein
LRQTSEIRAVCAKERPHGSARGAPGNRRPYRDSRAVVGNGPDKLKLIPQGVQYLPETEALPLPLFPVQEGYITVPDKPGLGIDPDPEIVKRYQV